MSKDKVLIIEDDNLIAELIRDYLLVENFDVEIMNDGQKGFDKVRDEKIDIVILDLMLPGLDGFEVLKKIRDIKDICVLIVSAKKGDIDKIKAFGLGADDYIIKPFSPSELVIRLKANLSRYKKLTKREINNMYENGELKVDFYSRKVFKNNIEIPFVNKEFELLEYFISNQDKVLSRDMIFDRVWKMDSLGDIQTVTVHIKRIREKIGEKYIETIWGAGYRFNTKI